MSSTTVKISRETRDRIREFGGVTHEDTIVAALDALDADRFWTQAETATKWRNELSQEERHRLDSRDAAIDAAFDNIE